MQISALSRFYSTPAFPAGAGPDYVNACARLDTELSAPALLDILHQVEAGLGRVRGVADAEQCALVRHVRT